MLTNKIQVVSLLAVGALAGAGGSSLATSITNDATIDVQTVRAQRVPVPDGGSVVMAETCGFVKTKAVRDVRVCERHTDARMTEMVVEGISRLEKQYAVDLERRKKTAEALEAARKNAGK